jgi:tetratricopeptide (TPR) repeat protein
MKPLNNLKNLLIAVMVLLFFIACEKPTERVIDQTIMASLGNKHKSDWEDLANIYRQQAQSDASNINAWLGLAETNVIIYVFGFSDRQSMLPEAKKAFQNAYSLDSTRSEVLKIKAVLSFLDWEWQEAETTFVESIKMDSANLSSRHWYSLYLMAMMRTEEAMEQSDIILSMDDEGGFTIGRGSMYYFARRFEEMKQLMIEAIAQDTTVAWGYDWLGMAYIELDEFEKSLDTYFKAFELSDGTVEVGAGLGHALGQAGKTELAKEMTAFYDEAAKENYLPSVQRAFIHIGIKEYDKAMELLEQAYEEQSWFLIFMQIEPWYDPIRNDPKLNKRFNAIIDKMEFPKGEE